MTNLDIRWTRLQRLAAEVAGREVQIHATTMMDENTRAEVNANRDRCDIELNLSMAKCEEDVLYSIAHELAHVTRHNPHHGKGFTGEVERIAELLRQGMTQKGRE